MPRVTKSLIAKKKHKKVLASTKGHYGARSRLFRTAKQSAIKSLQYAFRDRKNKKRDFRTLWISRINSGSRELGVSYSKLMNGLILNNVKINRKLLSEIAIHDNATFKKIVELASR
ncbi:50S ribosomal protein L20 [Gammaproteobacteria bacterium]|nr:50S ribosomal protein L20 [Gammaproteobacteria bacterium]